MKPNFALDLRHDGIGLLHRGKGGWTQVGEVALDDPDLSGKLAVLRKTAADLEQGGISTKLIIPNSQILYTSVEAPGPDDIAREVQIRTALEGLTPYEVGDLVFDWRAEGKMARVAVMARETMNEAESFAQEHKLNPVSFVARPGGGFPGEAFFGMTRVAPKLLGAGGRIERDDEPVPRMRAEPEPAKPEAEAAAPAPEPVPAQETPAQPSPAQAIDPAEEEARLRALLDDVPDPGDVTIEDEPEPAPENEADEDDLEPAVDIPVLAPFPPTPDMGEEEPVPFLPPAPARRRRRAAQTTKPVPAEAKALAPEPEPVTAVPVDEEPTPEADEPAAPDIGQTRADDEKPEAAVAVRPDAEATEPEPEPNVSIPDEATTAEPESATENTEAPLAAAGTDPEPEDKAKPLPAFSSRRSPAPGAVPGAVAAAGADQPSSAPPLMGGTRPGKDKHWRKNRAAARRAETVPPLTNGADPKPAFAHKPVTSPLEPPAPAAKQESAPAVPAPDLPPPPPRRAMPEIRPVRPVTVPPVPLPKTSMPEAMANAADKTGPDADGVTLFGARQEPDEKVGGKPRHLGLVLTLVLLLGMAAVALWSVLTSSDGDTSLLGQPAQNDFAAAAVPEAIAPSDTATETLPDTMPADQAAAAPDTDTAVSGMDATPGSQPFTDPDDIALLNDAEPEPDADTATDLATAPAVPEVLSDNAAQARYAATGIWQKAPEAPTAPGTDRVDDLYVASIDPVISSSDAVALPPGAGAGTDTPPGRPTPPPPPGSEFALDGDGLVTPTPGGTITPEGILVYSGQPPLVAPLRPQAAETETPAAPANTIPRVRPKPRPTSLVEDNERAQLGGVTLAELAAVRPAPRPISAQAEPDIDTTPTAQAVATSPPPDHRPSDFATVVARARENSNASDGSVVVASAPAVVTPSIPTRANVAAEATQRNAINLNQVNLIGIYGSASSRRALVRLKSGRYVKVTVGDRLDGGKVVSITDSKLVYQKGSKNLVLEVLPLG